MNKNGKLNNGKLLFLRDMALEKEALPKDRTQLQFPVPVFLKVSRIWIA